MTPLSLSQWAITISGFELAVTFGMLVFVKLLFSFLAQIPIVSAILNQ